MSFGDGVQYKLLVARKKTKDEREAELGKKSLMELRQMRDDAGLDPYEDLSTLLVLQKHRLIQQIIEAEYPHIMNS